MTRMSVRQHRWLHAGAALAFALGGTHARAVFVVTEPWVRPAAMGAATEAFMELASSEGATLVAVRSPAAARAAVVDARGRSFAKDGVPLPAGERVLLAPGGVRVSLAPLVRPLRLGDRVQLTLFVRAPDGVEQAIDVDAEVRRRSPTDDHRGHAHAHPH
jgi:periplasmic copper chaperone A